MYKDIRSDVIITKSGSSSAKRLQNGRAPAIFVVEISERMIFYLILTNK